MTIASVNPATGVLLRNFEPLTDNAVRARVAVAADAFRLHRQVPLDHRSLCLRKLATLLETETEELALLITTEMGKPTSQPARRWASAPPHVASTRSRLHACSPPNPSGPRRAPATFAGIRWASCWPSCLGTFLCGRFSAFSRRR